MGFAAVGDFAFDPDVGEVFGEKVADAGGELADGEGAAGGLKIESELGCHERKWRVASGERDTPHPPVFCGKSVEGVENTRDRVFRGAKECVIV